jgi:BASS family bile acid:Na+ symporter
MTTAQIVLLAIRISIIGIVFSLGLTTRAGDLTLLLRRPGLLIRSLASMSVLMPLFTVAAVRLLHPTQPTAIALIALSLAPVPPILLQRQSKAGGDVSYSVALLLFAALFSIVWVPLAIEGIQRIFGIPLSVTPMDVLKVVGVLVIAPLLAGALVAAVARDFAARAAPLLSKVALALLAIAAVLVLFKFWPAVIAQVGNGTVLAIIGFVFVGLAVGHLLGGPDESERTVLATATASRHPGLAVALAQLTFPGDRAAIATVLLYLLVSMLISTPYFVWRKRRGAAATPTAGLAAS